MFCKFLLCFLWTTCLMCVTDASVDDDKKVMIWVANPFNQTKLDAMIADLKTHRSSFTGIAYQFWAICGEGSNDAGGSKDCSPADAKGDPHLAPGHPVGVPNNLGKQLKSALGDTVELWPVISYGNPGDPTVINKLLGNSTLIDRFSADAIRFAHEQDLTGYNFDLETSPMVGIEPFLKRFTEALHQATPPVLVSYDTGNTPIGSAPMDRWISMSTYTSSLTDFKNGLKQGLATSGSKFGVGLCPICQTQGEQAARDRFDAIQYIGQGTIKELDLWAYGTGGDWPYFWTELEAWLRA